MILSENKVTHVVACAVGADLSANRAHLITWITMKISRLKPLLRPLVVGKTRLKRNLLIFMICCAAKPYWFI